MPLNPSSQAVIDESYKTQDVKVLSDKTRVADFPTEPRLLHFKTNNFIQQGLSRLLAYDASHNHFQLLQCNAEGELIVGLSRIWRDRISLTVFPATSIPSPGGLVSAALPIDGLRDLQVFARASAALTLIPKFSNDGTNWHVARTAADAAVVFALTTEQRSFPLVGIAPYLSFDVANATGSPVVLSLELYGQV